MGLFCKLKAWLKVSAIMSTSGKVFKPKTGQNLAGTHPLAPFSVFIS